MADGPVFGWQLVVGLTILLGLAVGVSWLGRLRLTREHLVAAARAVIQLVAVSVIIGGAIRRPGTSVIFAVAMFAIAAWSAAGRIGARRDVPAVALAVGAGVAPVVAVVFGVGVVPFTGPAIIPIVGIIIGGTMTAHVLTARRAFDTLRTSKGLVEAGLSLGLSRPVAIANVIDRYSPEALTPVLDQTRTVGLVTLPGAFVGVILGGGSAADAAASQLLVLIGLLAAESIAVVASQWLIARGWVMPDDLRSELPGG